MSITGNWDRHRMSRRDFLALGGMGAAALALGTMGSAQDASAAVTFSSYPFKLGVASGDPRPDGVVLWTRLAPDPLRGGGMPKQNVAVRWEVASDSAMTKIVRSGTAYATPQFAHSVHVEVGGLRPGRFYWYRFKAGTQVSQKGRTKTAPAFGSPLSAMAFAFVSCQDWQAGRYPAYSALAQERLDLVVHLGDYIYEGAAYSGAVRQHNGGEPTTLAAYRNRHALYKTDPALRAAHAAHPWVVTWDDHEVENNYAGLVSQDGLGLAARRAAAFRAYYEHMPLRRSSLPRGADMTIYRRLTYGNLAQFGVLDTRQYRTDQPCGDGLKERCAAALSESQTMTGPAQERWLLDGLGASTARWNVIAQQTIMAQYDHDIGPGGLYNMDAWDGYVAARNRMLGYLLNRKPSNPVVITGDVHSAWVSDLKADFRDEESATVGTEFIGTSITSRLPASAVDLVNRARPSNPHVKYFDGRPGGYTRCSLTHARWRTDLRLADSALNPASPVRTVASFVVENGRAGAVRV